MCQKLVHPLDHLFRWRRSRSNAGARTLRHLARRRCPQGSLSALTTKARCNSLSTNVYREGTKSRCKNNSPNRSSPLSRSSIQLDGEWSNAFKQFRARSTHQTDVCFTCGRWAPIFSRWRQNSRRANPCVRMIGDMLFFEASRSPTDPFC